LRALEWGHYFGLPSAVAKLLTGKWIISPSKWNLALTEAYVRKYASPEPVDDGTYTFYIARKKCFRYLMLEHRQTNIAFLSCLRRKILFRAYLCQHHLCQIQQWWLNRFFAILSRRYGRRVARLLDGWNQLWIDNQEPNAYFVERAIRMAQVNRRCN